MTYRNHSTRCRHGFCLESVGCEACGVKPDRKAMLALRASGPKERKRHDVPPGYGNSEGRKGGDGNLNARSRY